MGMVDRKKEKTVKWFLILSPWVTHQRFYSLALWPTIKGQ